MRIVGVTAVILCVSCATPDNRLKDEDRPASYGSGKFEAKWTHKAGVTVENVGRLKIGMTRNEVGKILGPSSSYTNMGGGTALYQWMKMTSSKYSARVIHVSLIFENGVYTEMHHYSVIDG